MPAVTTAPKIDLLVPPGITAEVARTRLVQALTNILTNAVEACEGNPSARTIQVMCEEREGHVALIIQDRGCGMSREATADARSLFATSKANGTGFGLRESDNRLTFPDEERVVPASPGTINPRAHSGTSRYAIRIGLWF